MNRRGRRRPVTHPGRRVDPKVALVSLLLVAAVVAAWLVWAAPARARAQDLAAELDSTHTQVAAVRDKIAALRSGEQSGAPALLERARALDAQMPPQLNKVDVVAAVPAIAAGFGLEVTRMDPKTSSGTALAFDTQVAGPHEAVMAFLTSVTAEGAAPLLSLGGLSVSVEESRTTASFTLRAHFSDVPPLGEVG